MEPRRSSRLAKKRVLMGSQGSTHDPENLTYYMEAVEQGWAGTGQSRPQYGLEDSEELSEEE